MTKSSRRPQRSKRERKNTVFWGNAQERYMKELRLRSKGGNTHSHAGCPGCEYCDNLKRNALLRRGFSDEWQHEYC